MINVLIVEDDPMVAELNRRYLERVEGFVAVGVVKTAAAALQFLATEAVDLLLLDIFMPGMNGLALLNEIRARQQRLDVILVTAASDQDSIEQALRHGAVDYMIKPFEYGRFQAALDAYKRRRELMQGPRSINQRELDEIVLQRRATVEAELPKGLDRTTLRRIWACILQRSEPFTADSMAHEVGISLGSMRKYLRYLQKLEMLEAQVGYGTVGRPVYRYQRLAGAAETGL